MHKMIKKSSALLRSINAFEMLLFFAYQMLSQLKHVKKLDPISKLARKSNSIKRSINGWNKLKKEL